MSRIRNVSWKEDQCLKSELSELVKRRYKRVEILTEVKKKYQYYAWSLKTLGNRLAFFQIKYIDDDIDLEDVYTAVRSELNGTGKDLGYRAMNKKVREIHNLKVQRDVVYNVMEDLDPEGLKARGNVGISKRPKRTKIFVSRVSSYYIWTVQ